MTDQTPPKRTYEQLEAELASTVMLFTQQGNTVVADLTLPSLSRRRRSPRFILSLLGRMGRLCAMRLLLTNYRA